MWFVESDKYLITEWFEITDIVRKCAGEKLGYLERKWHPGLLKIGMLTNFPSSQIMFQI